MNEKFIPVNKEELDQMDLEIVYVKFFCKKCLHTFGQSIYGGMIPRDRLVCFNCQNEKQVNK